jgi:hypothetical protein
VATRGEHGDHRLRTFRRCARIRDRQASGLLRGVQRGLGQIERVHVVPRLGEVRRHTPAHIAEPDETDPCHERLKLRLG